MEINITGKSIGVTPAVRSYVEKKLQKIDRIINDVMDAQVTIGIQKHLHKFDLVVKTRNAVFTSHGSTTDMFASINEGVESLLKQARRQKKKVQHHKGAKSLDQIETMGDDDVDDSKKPSVFREKMPVKPLSLEEAKLQVRGAENDFLLFRDAATSELCLIYIRDDGNLGLVETNQ